MKIIWRAGPKLTGQMATFHGRAWPSAEYEDGSYMAHIMCDDSYVPKNVKSGKHGPLTLRIADYGVNPNCDPKLPRWVSRKAKGTFTSIFEVKAALNRIIFKHPELVKREFR